VVSASIALRLPTRNILPTPSYPKLSTLTIVDGTAANTQIATTSATDPDTNTEFHYDFLDAYPVGTYDHDKLSDLYYFPRKK
jgi:hypothetical protein